MAALRMGTGQSGAKDEFYHPRASARARSSQ